MNVSNDSLLCQGLDMRDRMDWDGTFPHFEATKLGIVVHINKRSKLPGVFTDEGRARMSYNQYIAAHRKATKKGK